MRLSKLENLDFELLDLLSDEPELSQREIAERLGISVARANYCLKALKEKGAVKIRNFTAPDNMLAHAYVLTPEGLAHRARLAGAFLARKRTEYDRLKRQIASFESEFDLKDGS